MLAVLAASLATAAALPPAAPRPATTFSGHLALACGIGLSAEASWGPTEGPVALDAAATLGMISTWRLGFSAPIRFNERLLLAPFIGVAGVPKGNIWGPNTPGLAVTRLESPWSADLIGAFVGTRVRLGTDDRWLAFAPGWFLGGPLPAHAATSLDNFLALGTFGGAPPLVEWGWRCAPGVTLSLRTALTFINVGFDI